MVTCETVNGRGWIIDPIGGAAFEQLATGLAGSELQSVLLEVMQRRAAQRQPKDLLSQYQRDGLCQPAVTDLRTSVAVDAHLLAAAEGFEAIELSPVAPLGACSVVALTDQNRVLSALRTTEVVSDPTNVLALECALRLRASPKTAVHFATSQRVLRTQPIPKLPGYARHFRIYVLASGGQEGSAHAFTVGTLARHIRTMLGALDRLEQHGFGFGARRVDVLATAEQERLGDRVAAELGAIARRKPLEHDYYSGGLRYQLWVTTPDGAELPLIDGGVFDWLRKLTSDRRAVYVASGAGAQLIPLLFRVDGR
jgi:hypothetical protein